MPTDKRERQRHNREEKQKRVRRQQRIALLRRRLTQAIWIAVIVAAIVTISNLIANSPATTTTTTATSTTADSSTTTESTAAASALGATYEAFRSQETACGASAPPPAAVLQFDAAEDEQIDPASTVTATISTSCGDLILRLDPAAAPQTVNSFVFLARQGYFDGTVFHRIAPGFVIQGGDPTAVGTGGPGYTVPDEFPADGFSYDRGVVAMANAGADSTGSQFFIVLSDSGLPPTFSAFGTVIDGDATLDAIAAVPVGPSASGETSDPQQTVYIESVAIDISG